MSLEKPDIIARICSALSEGSLEKASEIARVEYPFVPGTNAGRAYTPLQSVRVFWRDGFVDRYSGARLVFPGTLRLLSRLMPEEFPAHTNWKMTESHLMFWELFPTVDHVVPVARGGADDESNWVCTSMLRNGAKANWTLAELGWEMCPPGDPHEWDGLMRWSTEFLEREPVLLGDKYIRRWNAAAKRALDPPPI